MSNTREKILNHALERFNDEGMESVGIRDIARALDLSPGNVSYHFSRKDDLVAALTGQLTELNAEALSKPVENLVDLLETFRTLFDNHRRYRFMFLSMVNLLENNPRLAANYPELDRSRRQQFHDRLVGLRGDGGLRRDTTDDELWTIVAHMMLIGRTWLVEKRLSFPDVDFDAAYAHYLRLVADVIRPRANKEGEAMLKPYLDASLLRL